MLKYTVKRLLQSCITILLIVSVVFLLLRLMPTDYYFTEDELIKLTLTYASNPASFKRSASSPILSYSQSPGQLFLPVTPADIRTKTDQSLIYLFLHFIRSRFIRCTLDRDRPMIVGSTGRTPGTILFFYVHANSSIFTDPIIRTCLQGRICKHISYCLH